MYRKVSNKPKEKFLFISSPRKDMLHQFKNRTKTYSVRMFFLITKVNRGVFSDQTIVYTGWETVALNKFIFPFEPKKLLGKIINSRKNASHAGRITTV